MAQGDLGYGPATTVAAVFQACRSSRNAALPQLVPVKQWRSAKPQQDASITLVTQLSLERLAVLRGQCLAWRDRISAVVYVPFVAGFGAVSAEVAALNGTSAAAITRMLSDLHKQAEADAAGCALDLELVAEHFSSWSEADAILLYPINAVRNRALMQSTTEALLLLDVDFLPSASVAAAYRGSPGAYTELMRQLVEERAAIVLPAFETVEKESEGRRHAAAAAAYGKSYALSSGRLLPFQVAQYSKGHTPTDYSRWPSASKPYKIRYEMGYEPYVIVARRHVPFFDERFRGYSRDKIVHLAHMASLGVQYIVHPEAFVVHSPHPKSATFRATKVSGQWDRLFELYVQVRKELASEVGFVPVTSFAASCPRHWEEQEYAEQHAQAAAKEAAERRRTRAEARKLQRGRRMAATHLL